MKRKGIVLLYLATSLTVVLVTMVGTGCLNLSGGTTEDFSGHSAYSFNDALYQQIKEVAKNDRIDTALLDELNLEIRAIFAHKCYQCHSRAKSKGDLALETQDQVMRGGGDGKIVMVGDAKNSPIIKRLELPRIHEDAMPPKGDGLIKEEIQLLKWWIDHGAHWSEKTFKQFREAPLVLEIPTVPEHIDLEHPVDIFVDRHFAAKGMQWQPLIDDRRFIRRAYLDLHGLLPTFDEVEGFLTDPDPDKRKLLVQQLIENRPAFAAHWMSFWNDMLRNDYTGIGYIEGGRKQISDWLYEALVTNKPYDDFVKEIINPTEKSEGFIKGIQWRGVVNASQRSELQAAQNISQTFLGLNLKCASCHNSFVNNVTLDEAYAFANVFAKQPLEIYRCDKPTGRYSGTAFIYPELGEVVGDSLKERLASLAGIIVLPENGRLYRTIVNRYWDRLFGRGIIAPVDQMDQLPWDQELLDWIAAKFVERDFDINWLLYTIMSSNAYQLPAVDYPSQGHVLSEQFEFRGPLPRRLTAEQFVDVFSKSITPIYAGTDFDPTHRNMDAFWIWHKEVELDRVAIPKIGKRYFRKTFSLQSVRNISEATLLITVDDKFIIYLNQHLIARGDNWRQVQKIPISKEILQIENCLAIEAENIGPLSNEAGVLCALRVVIEQKDTSLIYSDQTWKTSVEAQEDWTAHDYDETNWEEAFRYGRFTQSHWGKIPQFTFDVSTVSENLLRASFVKKDLFTTTLNRPVRENVNTKREDEATLLQALLLTNSPFFMERITTGANQWKGKYEDSNELVIALFQHMLGRIPTEREWKVIRTNLGSDTTAEQIADLIWSLLLLPEFQFI